VKKGGKFMSIVNLCDNEFEQQVLQSEQLVVVDFWAPWCGPCKTIAPILEELAKEYDGKIKIGKINIDENQKVTTRYQIMSIPSLLFFKKGKVAAQLVGVRSTADIKNTIDSLL
jgi:thioredoxin 1